MALFNQTIAFHEGATFIFGSWVCVADGAGGFQRHLKPTTEKRAAASTVDDLVENFGEITPSDIVRGLEFELFSTGILPQIALSGSNTTPTGSLITHPCQPRFGLRNVAIVYQEASRKMFEAVLDKDPCHRLSGG
ncbi:unnamed protein product [Urochloa humidicola]